MNMFVLYMYFICTYIYMHKNCRYFRVTSISKRLHQEMHSRSLEPDSIPGRGIGMSSIAGVTPRSLDGFTENPKITWMMTGGSPMAMETSIMWLVNS